MFPKMGPLWKQMPIFRALLSISFRVPSKGAVPLGSPHRAPSERDALFPEPSFIHISKSLVNEPPPSSPAGPLWKEMPISRASLIPSVTSKLDCPQSSSDLLEKRNVSFLYWGANPRLSVPVAYLPYRMRYAGLSLQ
jgi:hypothetical protein